MGINKLVIPLSIYDRVIELTLYGENSGETIIVKEDAFENGEALVQIKEGLSYEYKIENGYLLRPSEIVSHSNISESSGRIKPSIYVGTLNIDVLKSGTNNKCGEFKLEVQSVKANYRNDYRLMLEDITEKCTDLLLQYNSPVSQNFEVDYNADAKTLYQRFAFIKSIIDSVDFDDAIHKILTSPVTRWREAETTKDIRSVKRISGSHLRQIVSSTNRIVLPIDHDFKKIVESIPSKINVGFKIETIDTNENRFIKHALISFKNICSEFKIKVKDFDRIKLEAVLLEEKLDNYLGHSFFKEVSSLSTIPLNSPVLQRKEGYREILRVWLMFDLAAKLVWKGGDDVYSGNKKDVAVLYEYWLFFKLLEIVNDIFGVDGFISANLIEQTVDGLGLKLKQGRHLPIRGTFNSQTRKLNIDFSYNKTFNGENKYPQGGSWTRSLRPDFTLSIWPYLPGKTFQESQIIAEEEELIVHIHFDAKYKVESIQNIFGNDDNLDVEKEEQNKGTYKRADLLKMHAYKDAIRRTGGAYILYPGTENSYKRLGFHEIIPGLGAFSIRPSKLNSGIEELKKFLFEVLQHFMNRASQREIMSFKTYETHKKSVSNFVKEALPEAYGVNRNFLPDETYVLLGYSKNKERLLWYEKNRKYVFRMGESEGSLELNSEVVKAKYLLIRKSGTDKASDIFRIISSGPKVYSKDQLDDINYPLSKRPQNYYLVIDIEREVESEFKNIEWQFSKLKKYNEILRLVKNPYTKAGLPFTVTLTELMNTVVK